MPRPKKPGAPEPKRRSRTGCWSCKARKVKCGEEKPICVNCQRTGDTCDYNIRLNWEGRRTRSSDFRNVEFRSPTGAEPPQRKQPVNTGANVANLANAASAVPLLLNQNQPSAAGPTVPALRTPTELGGDLASRSLPSIKLDLSIRDDSVNAGHVLQFNESSSPGGRELASPGHGTFTVLGSEALTPETVKSGSTPRFDSPHGGSGVQPPPKKARHSQELHGSEIKAVFSSPASTAELSAANRALQSATNVLTPAASSSYSDDDSGLAARRLHVSSLLTSPSESSFAQEDNYKGAESVLLRIATQATTGSSYEPATFYGIDRGFRDLDVGKNDDANALSGSSPVLSGDNRDLSFTSIRSGVFPFEFGFGVGGSVDSEQEPGGYYQKPVPVRIPRSLEPLPSKLTDNPMNLLYFHHFLNHTARVLVPHDDPQSNPFRTVLPQMAVRNDNLLSLLLAYSASHRARLLKQPEPSVRIAHWVEDIFPALRAALAEPTASVSTANLATAIMLASLEIISPTAFGYAIPWQEHLSLARELVTTRPGGLHRDRAASTAPSQEDQVYSFLWSWFAYLDVLAGLSGGPADSSTAAWILDREADDANEGENNNSDDEIDCVMGFTTRCVYVLAKVAGLARACDAQRIGRDHRVNPDWQPTADVVARARKLEVDAHRSLATPPRPCRHAHHAAAGGVTPAATAWDHAEMAATNEAFHWAGLVHLHRRVLGKPSRHPDVQDAVRGIVACLASVRRGGTAEACLLFPMFTAGCDTADLEQRRDILARVLMVERNGMTQVGRARRLMERVWETGQPWETLLSNEFIG